jgi:hypothetical protein
MGNQRLEEWQILIALKMLKAGRHQRIICEEAGISPNTLQLIKNQMNYFPLTPSLIRVFMNEMAETWNIYQTTLGREMRRIENILSQSAEDRIKAVILEEREYELGQLSLSAKKIHIIN